jgi:protein-tyrosine sulfotransferase
VTSEEGERFIFVGGAPRSGTTLVQNMLDMHPAIAGGPEFLHLTKILALRDSLKKKVANGRIDAFCSAVDVDRAVRGMIEALLLPLADREGRRLLSEKTPANCLVFEPLMELFPRARCVFVLRDPRAIVASMLEVGRRGRAMGLSPRPYTRSLRAAVAHVEACFHAGFAAEKAAPDRVLAVEYAALVTDPATETRRICAFLGLPWSPEMRIPASRSHIGEKAITVNDRNLWYDAQSFRRDPDPSGIDRWRSRLTPHQAALIGASFAGMAPLDRFGYDLQDALTPGGRALEAAYRGLERGRAGLQRALRSERLLTLLGAAPLLG